MEDPRTFREAVLGGRDSVKGFHVMATPEDLLGNQLHQAATGLGDQLSGPLS